METIQQVCRLTTPNDYLTSIDLAFLHILIHSTSRKYLQFRMERQFMPVQDVSFRPLTQSFGIHQDTEASTTLGKEKRYTDIGLYRRSNHCREVEGDNSPSHISCHQETGRTGLSIQGIEVISQSNKENRPTRIHHRHQQHDLISTQPEAQRLTTRSNSTTTTEGMQLATSIIIHRQGIGSISHSIPSSTENPAPITFEESVHSPELTMDSNSDDISRSKSRVDLMDKSFRKWNGLFFLPETPSQKYSRMHQTRDGV